MDFEFNVIYNEDCMSVMNRMQDCCVDLICTDPPYRISSRGSSGGTGGMLATKASKEGRIFEYNDIDCEQYAPEFYRILKNGCHCYVMCNHINLLHMLQVFTDSGFHFVRSLIWNKCNKIVNQYYMSQFEYILFFRKGPARPINNPGTSDILSIPNKKTKDEFGKNIHDTEKPVDLMKILIENSTNPGEIVFEPFAGSGSTLVAAKELGRDFIGCEIDPDYHKTCTGRVFCAVRSDLTEESLW